MNERYIVEAFARRRRRLTRVTVSLGVVIGVIALLGMMGLGIELLVLPLLLAGFAFGLMVNRRIWRCPKCNGHLGKLYFGLPEPKHCPQCGVRLIK